MENNNNPTQTAESTVMTPKSKVTKHPGRVEAGKRLVEWNKQTKLNQQAKEALRSDEENTKTHFSPKVKQQQSPVSYSNLYMIAGVVLMSGFYLGYRLYNKSKVKPQAVESEVINTGKEQSVKEQLPKKSVHDPFDM